MLGAEGAVNTTGLLAYATSHMPLEFLALILYVPAANPVNEPLFCQFAPLSIEYCKLVPD